MAANPRVCRAIIRVRSGGDIRGGHVVGEASPEPKFNDKDRMKDVKKPFWVQDIHSTVLHTLDIDFTKQEPTPVGRPMFISEGKVIEELLAKNA